MPHHTRLLSDFDLSQLKSTISPYAGARMAGLPDWVAQIIQWGFSGIALAAAVVVYLRRGADPRAMALALLVVVLALPYSNAYDLAMAASALTLALFAENSTDDRLLLPFVPALLLWTLPVLAPLFGVASWPVLPLVLGVVVLIALAREAAPGAGRIGRLLGPDRVGVER